MHPPVVCALPRRAIGKRYTYDNFLLSECKLIRGKTTYNEAMTDSVNDVREALEALKRDEISAREVRVEFGHVDGIERLISVAVASVSRI